MSKIKVIIADDHPIFRIGLANVIKASKSLILIGEAVNGKEAKELITSLKPDVAVLDIDMPYFNGLQVCEEICKKKDNATKIIILTLFKEIDLYKKALEVGAEGYLLKDNAVDELVVSIEAIFNGENYISEGLSEKLIDKKSHLISDKTLNDNIRKLTSTEKSILLLVADNKTTKEIAKKLFVSEKTIENHRYNINKKLELTGGQNSLLIFALENKFYFQ